MKFKVWEFGARYADEVVEIECESWREAAEACCSVNTETIVVEDESGQQKEYTVDPSIEWDVQLESVGHIEDRPTGERPRLWRVISVDGFGGEGPNSDDELIASHIARREDATVMCGALNDARPRGVSRFYKVVDADYQLKEFRP